MQLTLLNIFLQTSTLLCYISFCITTMLIHNFIRGTKNWLIKHAIGKWLMSKFMFKPTSQLVISKEHFCLSERQIFVGFFTKTFGALSSLTKNKKYNYWIFILKTVTVVKNCFHKRQIYIESKLSSFPLDTRMTVSIFVFQILTLIISKVVSG